MKRHSRSAQVSLALLAALILAPQTRVAGAQGVTPPLVSDEKALAATEPVLLAVTVDAGTISSREVDGEPGVGFSARGASGAVLQVELVGKVPAGFEVAPVVVLVGTATDGLFRADRVLIPGAAPASDASRGLKAVLAVTMVVWVGLFLYVFMLDRRLRRLEE
jgi:CcmD family protein